MNAMTDTPDTAESLSVDERDVLETLRDCGGTLRRERHADTADSLGYRGTPRPMRMMRSYSVPRAIEKTVIARRLARRTDETLTITDAGCAALDDGAGS